MIKSRIKEAAHAAYIRSCEMHTNYVVKHMAKNIQETQATIRG
jgi:hypothetical protein